MSYLSLGSAAEVFAEEQTQDSAASSPGEVEDKSAANLANDPDDGQATSWISAGLGAEVGGRTSAGGLAVRGAYDHRVTQDDWFVTGAQFVLGSGKATCFRDRDNDILCDHKAFEGFAAEISLSIRRRFPLRDGRFRPYANLGVGARLIGFSGDEIRGLGIPVIAGGGILISLGDSVQLLAGGELRLGGAYFTRVGLEPQANLDMVFGAIFGLD